VSVTSAAESKDDADIQIVLGGVSVSAAGELRAVGGVAIQLDGIGISVAAYHSGVAEGEVKVTLDGVSARLTAYHPDYSETADFEIPPRPVYVDIDYSEPLADLGTAKSAPLAKYRRPVAEANYRFPMVVRVSLDHRGKMLSFQDYVTVDEAVAFGFLAVFNDDVAASDQVSFGHATVFDDGVTATDGLTLTTEFNLQFSDSVTATDDGAVIDFGAVFNDSVAVSDSLDIVLELGFDHLINGEEINVATIN